MWIEECYKDTWHISLKLHVSIPIRFHSKPDVLRPPSLHACLILAHKALGRRTFNPRVSVLRNDAYGEPFKSCTYLFASSAASWLVVCIQWVGKLGLALTSWKFESLSMDVQSFTKDDHDDDDLSTSDKQASRLQICHFLSTVITAPGGMLISHRKCGCTWCFDPIEELYGTITWHLSRWDSSLVCPWRVLNWASQPWNPGEIFSFAQGFFFA